VALGDINLHFAWQALSLITSTSTLRGRRGTYYGIGLSLVTRLGLAGAAGVCVVPHLPRKVLRRLPDPSAPPEPAMQSKLHFGASDL